MWIGLNISGNNSDTLYKILTGKFKLFDKAKPKTISIKKILKHLGLWEIKARPPPRAIVAAKNPEYHIDYSTSQVPVPARRLSGGSDNYLYVDPVYSDGHPA